ncbi:MAG: response regulator, partial [SAR324 cluster bacterium]|nr:response regulator [SAR324 cluster bacterium]
NDTARKITSSQLKSLCYQPICVTSGEAALETIASTDSKGSPFDLVLMDWRMSGINGLEATRRIKNTLGLAKVPKIIMVTAFGAQEVIPSQEEKDLLDGFLMKPITISTLSDTILTAFGYQPTSHLISETNEDSTSGLAGSKLLLVEDNEINQQVASELLEQVQIQVITANNGQEAIDLLKQEPFDGILMDLQMPVMDGLAATKRIRQDKKLLEIPIIAMTANAMVGDREKCLNAGMNDHVGKPVVPKELYTTLAKWIQKKPGDASQRTILPVPNESEKSVILLPPISGINTTIGLRNVGKNSALYKKVLLKFVQNQGDSCRKMAVHMEAKDYQALEQTAHALKGVSSTIGAEKLAELAGTIENRAQKQEVRDDLSDLLGETTIELARISQSIRTSLVVASTESDEQNQEKTDVEPEILAPLFTKAVQLLNDFDSAVEKVVVEIVPLVSSEPRLNRIKSIKKSLESYDFDTCLSIFHEWAEEEGIELKGNPHE